ncbi:hypothetical protein BGW80DRAFT_1322467, partial [Lactifluus volemus]
MGSEISPAPILQEHREAALRRSQLQNAMIVLTAALRNSLSSSPDIQMTMSFSRELSLAPHSTEIAPSDPFRLPVHGVETFQAVAEPMTKPDRPGSPLRIPTTAGVPKEPT